MTASEAAGHVTSVSKLCFDVMSDYVITKESNEVYDSNEHFLFIEICLL